MTDSLRDLSRAAWPDASELRIGLGCMRLSTDEARDEGRALETIAAAVQAGITVFDTAHGYGHGPDELGHNESLLARALRGAGVAERARIVTKGGMTRAGGGWIADGRAKAIRADCEASLEALDGIPIDLYLIHAPDPRTPWTTSVRALGRLVDDGVVRSVGVANVNRRQLDEAFDHAPIAAVQVALSPFDDSALRGGVLERCVERGLALVAHSPLGGPRRAGSVDRQQALVAVAESHGVTPAEVALAWLLELSPVVLPIPGARRPETARSAARAAALELDDADRATLAAAFGGARPAPASSRSAAGAGEVVVVMGIPGAGKSRVAEDYVARGYARLNRDERGGSLRALAETLDEELASGTRRLVLDNTYLTRASRSYVVESAMRHGVPARCVWLDTPLAQAQVNLVQRLLERFGSLPSPEEVREAAKREPGIHAPTTQMRTFRDLEPPADDEGFAIVERIEFERASAEGSAGAVFVAAPVLRQPGWEQAIDKGELTAPHLVYDWDPDGAADALASPAAALAKRVSGPVETALCPHPAGPPVCWCRPPLPGLALAFARAHHVDTARSTLIGNAPAHRTLATTLGARFVEA
jgi:aryl-alcohol dehydrogenase-like predicted oxidoreductase/predicted kinase